MQDVYLCPSLKGNINNMEEFGNFLYANLWIVILFLVVLSVYILFELSQYQQNASTVSPQEAVSLTSRQKGLIIDVRDEKAFKEGHIVGAKHISLEKLKSSTKSLARYKQSPIVLYCDNGQQSKTASQFLKQQGFEKPVILLGGFQQWKQESMPVEKSKDQSKQTDTTKDNKEEKG